MLSKNIFRNVPLKHYARRYSMFVSSHNIMDGLYINKLLRHYRELKEKAKGTPIFLCIQENVIYNDVEESSNYNNDGHILKSAADVISNCLSSGTPSTYTSVTSTDTRLSTIYNTNFVDLIESKTVYLPKLEKLSLPNRIAGFRVEDKTILVTRFQLKNHHDRMQRSSKENISHNCRSSSTAEPSFTIVNFHLDAAGDNKHRMMQFQGIADILHAKESFVLCGDTNLFSFFPTPSKQYDLLNEMVKPIASKTGAGIVGDCSQPTHFFSRANEPKLGHQIVYKLGKLGLDIPGCYDVLISNMKEDIVGQIDTPFSDHNLVYAKFDL